MQLGMVGLGRMGANMARRVMRAGHECVVWNRSPEAVNELAAEGAVGTHTLEDLVAALTPPRSVWIMLPQKVVDGTVDQLRELLDAGDVVIDGGNSDWRDDRAKAARLGERGIQYLDAGTSGGVWGLERGYCLMVGGPEAAVAQLAPVLQALAPGRDAAPPTPGRAEGGTAHEGWLHCGPTGAGHFVKMVHNGIEYGVMAAYAEGFNILRQATMDGDDFSSVRESEAYGLDLNIPEVAELWRRGSVIGSWLLDLTAESLVRDPTLERFEGHVSDSGEGRWTLLAAIDEGVPAPVIASALFSRFESRGRATYANKLLSAMRAGFGGHTEPS